MPELNSANIKTPKELKRLIALADVDVKQLTKMVGLKRSSINNLLNDKSKRKNYLFQFALEYLIEQKKEEIYLKDAKFYVPKSAST